LSKVGLRALYTLSLFAGIDWRHLMSFGAIHRYSMWFGVVWRYFHVVWCVWCGLAFFVVLWIVFRKIAGVLLFYLA
jgi:hypothetical protein